MATLRMVFPYDIHHRVGEGYTYWYGLYLIGRKRVDIGAKLRAPTTT